MHLLNVKSLVIAITADSLENHLPSLCVETQMFGVGAVLRDNVSKPFILQIRKPRLSDVPSLE